MRTFSSLSTSFRYVKGAVQASLFGVLLLAGLKANAQAPTISYASPQTYSAGIAITPLTPAVTGGASLSYAAPVTILSGLSQPQGVAIDASGNLYFSTKGDNSVYKVAAGTSTPVSYGSGFKTPLGIALDPTGNLFVADFGNHYIKKVPAGGGTPVNVLNINYPQTVAYAAPGILYIATGATASGTSGDGLYETSSSVIGDNNPVQITSTAGDVANSSGVTVDQKGNIYFSGDQNIIKYPAGTTTPVLEASGIDPYAIAIDPSGNIFFTETAENDVKEILADGSGIITVATGLRGPRGITIDSQDKIYVASQNGSAIETISPKGGYFISPQLPAGMVFSSNTGILSGIATVASAATSYTVLAYNSSGSGTAGVNITVNMPPSPSLSYASPQSYSGGAPITPLAPTSSSVGTLAYGSPLLIQEPYNIGSLTFDYAGNMYFVSPGGEAFELPAGSSSPKLLSAQLNNNSQGIAVDASGNVYVAEDISGASDIKEIPAGTTTLITYASGFNSLMGLSIDINGNLYTADYGNNAVYRIPAGGGAAVAIGSGFVNPSWVAIDAAGDVFVTDYQTSTASNLKKIPSGGGGVVTIGTLSLTGNIATDPAGNVFVPVQIPSYYNVFATANAAIGIEEYPAGSTTPVILDVADNYYPPGTAVDPKGNIFYSAPNTSWHLREIKPAGGYFIDRLPRGLAISDATGTISGTPATTMAAATYHAIAYNRSGSATSNITIATASTFLSALTLSRGTLSPAFAVATTNYTAFIGTAATSVTVTPTVSDPSFTITVNGTAVLSGHASPAIALSPGPTTITIVVTAADGVTKTTYTVIAGAGSNVAYMGNIRIDNGAIKLSPSFAYQTLSYTASVDNGATSVTVTPFVLNATATVTVNGVAVASGTASGAIPLNAGPNTITVTGRAQDSITYTTYTIVVTRAPSNDAYLATLGVTDETISPSFAFKTFNYTANVANNVSSVTVRAVVLQANATIKVNGTALASGSTSAPIAVAVGSNVIDVVVTAQDGTTTNTYTITVTRAGPVAEPVDAYQPISVSDPNSNPAIIGEDIKVHQAVSPNGDGIDDVFTIDNIANYPQNNVMIMDRNGAVIYQAKGYDNVTKAFDGHSNVNGRMQLPGTYFYALDYTVNGITRRKTGFIVLKY